MTDVRVTTRALTREQSRALAEQSYKEQDPLAVEAERKKNEYNKKVLAREEKRKAAEAAAARTQEVNMRASQEKRWDKKPPLSDAELARRKEVYALARGPGNFYRRAKKAEEESLKKIRERADEMRKEEEAAAAADKAAGGSDANAPPASKEGRKTNKPGFLARFFGKGEKKGGRKRITRKKRGGRKRKNKTKTKRKTLRKSHKKRRKMARRKKTKRRR